MESLTEEKQQMIQTALNMYHTASMMPEHMIQDANAIAAKAKTLMNKALEGVIEMPPSTTSVN